jgi:hypothetical protein
VVVGLVVVVGLEVVLVGLGVVLVGLVVLVAGVVAGGLAADRLGTGIPALVVETGGSVAEGVAVGRADRLGVPVGTPLPTFPPLAPQLDKSRAEAAMMTPAAPVTRRCPAGRGVP